VVFIGPKRLKLVNMIASQKTRMTRNGAGIEPPLWANNNKRNCERLFAASVIWPLKPRCISVWVGRLLTRRHVSTLAAVGVNAPAWADFSPSFHNFWTIPCTLLRSFSRAGLTSGPYSESNWSIKIILAVI